MLAALAFDPSVHLALGNVSISDDWQVVCIFLKADRFGRGTEVFLGTTGDELCPVRVAHSYTTVCGTSPGASSAPRTAPR